MHSVSLYVMTHKLFNPPVGDIFIPLHVGRALGENLGYTNDNIGDNISEKNTTFCELTGLYWIWKNSVSPYIGLCHYRRFFLKNSCIFRNLDICEKFFKLPILSKTCFCYKRKFFTKHFGDINDIYSALLNYEDIISYLDKYDLILPIRLYMQNTILAQYAGSHYEKDLLETGKIIEKRYPEYTNAFYETINRNYVYFTNMFVGKKEKVDDYCQWLFPILFELEDRLCLQEYDKHQKRVFGFLAERLFNVWLQHNKLRLKEVSLLFIDNHSNSNEKCAYTTEFICRSGRTSTKVKALQNTLLNPNKKS